MALRSFHAKKASEHRELAMEHIRSLFGQAERCSRDDTALANRYAQHAHRIAMKFKLKLPSLLKRCMCKHCHHYLRQGVNCRVRLTQGKVVYYCMDCRHFMRFPIKGQKKDIRKNVARGKTSIKRSLIA